jgi:hypothetical protein
LVLELLFLGFGEPATDSILFITTPGHDEDAICDCEGHSSAEEEGGGGIVLVNDEAQLVKPETGISQTLIGMMEMDMSPEREREKKDGQWR